MTVWTYWEGDQSPIIALCLRTLALHNPTLRVVGPAELQELGGGEALQATEGMPKPYRSDLVRLWLLREFGGLWVDADSIATHPLSIVEEATGYDLWGVFHPQKSRGGLLAAPFGCRAGSPVIADGYDRCVAMLERYRRTGRMQYGSTSVGLLSALWRDHRRANLLRREHWRWFPVHWQSCRAVYNRRGANHRHAWAGAWNPNAELYHLTNVVTHDQREIDLASSNTFAAFVFRKSLRLRPAVTGRSLEAVARLEGVASPRMIEVGTNLGENAEALLFQRRDLQLTCVDPWAAPTERYAKSEPYRRKQNWQHTFARVRKRLRPFGDRVTFDRRRSLDAAADVAPRSVDLVFLDAEHTAAAVAEDVRAWAPKVRPGGWIGGHDYGHKWFPGVRQSVDAWAAEHGLTIERGRDMTWWAQV